MTKKKVLKITPILVMINILILLIIVGFYISRMYKYYKLENSPKKSSEIKLVNRIIETQSYLDITKGLVYNKADDTYVFKGLADNNYLEYSGFLFRILSIDTNKNIKLVSDEVLTLMYSGLENGFNDSYINKWLNKSDIENTGIFENVLYKSESLLINSMFCDDKIEDINAIKCENKNNNNKIVLLDLNDYKNAGGKNSFINNGEFFYLANIDTSNNNYYVNNNGEVGINEISSRIYGVRPVITINGSTLYLNGNGSKDNPYKIEKHTISTLGDTYIGDIISIDEDNYKVINKDDKTVKLVLNDVYKIDDKPVEVIFSKEHNVYTSNNDLFEYLNNKYLDTISIKDEIIPRKWYIGKQTLDNLDYLSVYESDSYAKIGMLNLGDFYLNDVNNIFTLSRGIEDDNIINTINEDGYFYGDLVTNEHYIRPSFSLNGNISITGGIGSLDGPYEIGELNEKE